MNDLSNVQFNPALASPVAKTQRSGSRTSAQAVGQGGSFADTLAEVQDITFSNHAQKRLQKRDIQLDDQSVNRLVDAVNKVEKRGGKSSLVLVDDLAFIVNVTERLVVTALDTKERGEGVFNQIDSVVFAAPTEA